MEQYSGLGLPSWLIGMGKIAVATGNSSTSVTIYYDVPPVAIPKTAAHAQAIKATSTIRTLILQDGTRVTVTLSLSSAFAQSLEMVIQGKSDDDSGATTEFFSLADPNVAKCTSSDGSVDIAGILTVTW